ncbi:MAG: hypothetical protein AMK70_11940, partial [Nitrospira bacterium SG8_35_1]
VLVALVLLIGLSFILGLIMMSDIGRRFGDWIERIILGRIPGYNAIKNLITGFASSQQESSFKPALLKSSDGGKEFVYIVEDHGDGNCTIMQPWTPTPFAGSILCRFYQDSCKGPGGASQYQHGQTDRGPEPMGCRLKGYSEGLIASVQSFKFCHSKKYAYYQFHHTFLSFRTNVRNLKIETIPKRSLQPFDCSR